MARFKPASDVTAAPVAAAKNHPFKNVYACAEGDMIYVNMEAVQVLQKGMKTLRDIALIVDISGSMRSYYTSGKVKDMVTQIVDSLAWADDDGIDLYFFADGQVYNQNVKSAAEVNGALDAASKARGAWGTTMPTECFKNFCEQIKSKNRAGTVLFLTDGAMDDGGKSLKALYQNYLHGEFKTRDNFYCYAVEFGRAAYGALNVLDGLYAPEQGPEDLFDLDNIESVDKIAAVLKQVGGMSAVGSDVSLKASVDNGAKIDMVNADLIEGGMTSIDGAINQVMSFRVRATSPFNLDIAIPGHDTMKIKVTPEGPDVKVEVA